MDNASVPYNNPNNEIIPTNNVEHLLKDILEENKVLREKISNLELGNTINNNQQYSINFFLNEKCKNAMNLTNLKYPKLNQFFKLINSFMHL